MKATLTYNLPEEFTELRQSLEAPLWQSVVWEMDRWLRDEAKYAERDYVTVDEARSKLLGEMVDRGLEFD